MVGVGSWDNVIEEVFQKRLGELGDPNIKPLSAGEWRARIRLPSFLREAQGVNAEVSSTFLNLKVPAL